MAKQATHKLSGLGTKIITTVSRDELPDIITAAAEDGHATGLRSDGKVHIEHVSPDEIELAVRNAFKRVAMTFSVSVQGSDSGTSIHVGIDSFLTSQNTFFFIPVGPKMLAGKNAYICFLDSLDERVRAMDPSASVERVGEA